MQFSNTSSVFMRSFAALSLSLFLTVGCSDAETAAPKNPTDGADTAGSNNSDASNCQPGDTNDSGNDASTDGAGNDSGTDTNTDNGNTGTNCEPDTDSGDSGDCLVILSQVPQAGIQGGQGDPRPRLFPRRVRGQESGRDRRRRER